MDTGVEREGTDYRGPLETDDALGYAPNAMIPRQFAEKREAVAEPSLFADMSFAGCAARAAARGKAIAMR